MIEVIDRIHTGCIREIIYFKFPTLPAYDAVNISLNTTLYTNVQQSYYRPNPDKELNPTKRTSKVSKYTASITAYTEFM